MKRRNGEGSVYQRADGMWCGSAHVGEGEARKRRTVYGRDEATARRKLAELTGPIELRPVLSRAEYMAAAQRIATHTAREWTDKIRSTPKACPYCDVELNTFNDSKDHIIPISRGGSDGIDNVQRTCWECNMAKGDSLDFEYNGPRPRPFRVAPKLRTQYQNLMRFRDGL